MASSATTRGGYRKQGLADNLNTWGLTSGVNGVFDIMDEGVHGVETISLTGNKTLSSTNYTTNEARHPVHRFTDGGLSAVPTITVPSTEGHWMMDNTTVYALTVSNGGVTASVSAGRRAHVYTNGTDCYAIDMLQSADLNDFTAGLPYKFSTSTTDAAPGAGYLRLDHATISSATGIYIDDQVVGGADASAWMRTWDDSTSAITGFVTIQKKDTPTTNAIFSVSALADDTDYIDLTVAYIAGSGSFAANDDLFLFFSRTGDKGDTGSQGPTGDVGGPVSSTDNALTRWNGTSGASLQNSGWVLGDSNGMTAGGTLNMNASELNNAEMEGERWGETANGSVSANQNITVAAPYQQGYTLAADIDITLAAPASNKGYGKLIKLTQDGTGGRAPTIKNAGGAEGTWLNTEPTWTGRAAASFDIVTALYDADGSLYLSHIFGD